MNQVIYLMKIYNVKNKIFNIMIKSFYKIIKEHFLKYFYICIAKINSLIKIK